MSIKDKYKRVPRYIKLNGVPVGIGGKVKISGKEFKEATAKQYKEIQKLMPAFFEETKKEEKPDQ